MQKLVTVVMAVYNGEKFIKESIDCILNQTYANFDLNIINDVSDKSRLYIYNKHYSIFKENKLDFTSLITTFNKNNKYKVKYYNVWYRKIFYSFKKRK